MYGSLSHSQSHQVFCSGFQAFIISISGKLIRYDAQYQMIIKSNRQHWGNVISSIAIKLPMVIGSSSVMRAFQWNQIAQNYYIAELNDIELISLPAYY